MKAQDLITAFQSYLAARDGYIPNTSGETWTAEKQAKTTGETVQRYGYQWIGHRVEDCSGAFVRAYKAHGLSIYHGSNRIAREYVDELLPPSAAKPGMMAFKLRKPGKKYYDLPSEYKQGGRHYNGDLNDYYHIGLVDDNPAYVINAQSTQTGVVRSKLTNGWDCVAWPKAVQHSDKGGESMPNTNQYRVTANDVNLRVAKDKGADRVEYLNRGDVVELGIDYGDGWAYVVHGRKSGYVRKEYLEQMEGTAEVEPLPVQEPAQACMPAVDEATVQLLYDAMAANEKLREDAEAEWQALLKLQQALTGAVG